MMDFESAPLRLGSPDPLALGPSALASERITSGSNHRRSSFTEYRSLLSSSLLDRSSSPPITSSNTTTRPSYLSSSLRDEPPLFSSSYIAGSKYKSSYDKYSPSTALTASHLDDNNASGIGAGKYTFLDDALTTPSSSSKLAATANHHHHHEPISSSSLFAHSNSSTALHTLGKYNSNTTNSTALGGLNSDSRFVTTSNNLIGTTSSTTTTAGKQLNAPATTTTTTTSSSTIAGAKLLANEEMAQIHELVDSIEIPARGRCKVFMAKYGYDPFKQSPNDNPDAELAFNAGDYIMVFDDIDEDGYFIGELMDGRRGYVPSNWLYRLTSDDLLEFQASVLYRQAGQPEGGPGAGFGLNSGDANLKSGGLNSLLQSASLFAANHSDGLLMGDDNANSLLDGVAGGHQNSGYPPEFYDAIISDTMNHSNFQHLLAPEDYHRMNDYVDLDDVNEVDDECLSDYERAEAEQMRRAVPPPQRLVLERQLNKCILIAWLHPQAAKGTIVSYQVYVDGVLKSTVPSGDRTKALLEGVDSNIPHRISVRAIDLNGRHSNDAGCTIVIGQKIPFAPSCVKASHITSDSALISWLPCNSNFHHVVAVNSVEVQTVRPGVYKHLINGLSANTLYRVWVRAKPGKILSIDEKNPNKLESLTTYVDFKTMPKSLPDPPVNVQVEAGPQRRTLLVTWLPLTLNDYGGSSNGCAVTGYAVFAGHKKLAEIDSPTGDHALLDIGDLESLHKKSVTVRTKSGENLSQDSMPCQIPDEYLKQARDIPAPGSNAAGRAHHSTSGHQRTHYQNAISQSPSRQRMQQAPAASAMRRYNQTASIASQQQHQNQAAAAARRVSRPLTRSLHNLESDLESRRSSIPPYELNARETSGSELMNQTESYSEEEFENSMRFRGSSRGRAGGQSSRAGQGHLNRLRARQSHSVDRNHHLANQFNGGAQLNGPQSRQMNAQTQLMSQQRFRSGVTSSTPVGEIRFFVALFDYDPSTMSPNPNAINEELAFKEGSIIKVYGGLGEDGFYKGELLESRATGFVPCNVITEITDTNLLASLYEKSNLLQPMGAGGQVPIQAQQPPNQLGTGATATRQQPMDPMQQQPANVAMGQTAQNQQNQSAATGGGGAVKRMVALYDYDPQENSPNADTESEIPFKTGDIIFVYGKMDTDGFYMGEVERTKQRGLVPSNFLREEPLPLSKQQQMMQMQQQQQQLGVGAASAKQMAMAANTQQFGSQQQQQMNANYQQQLRANQSNLIRGQMATNVNQQQAQNVNRPNSLSLGAQANNSQQQQMMMMNNQQMALQMQQNGLAQPQQALQQNNAQFGIGPVQNLAANQMGQTGGQFVGSNDMVTNRGQMMLNLQQQQQLQGLNQQQMNLQRQQQQLAGNNQQQSGSGVLSNLLSSGKQIIGAATTPRMPNQSGAFQSGGPQAMMGPNANQQLNQQQQQQARAMMMANNQMQMDNSQTNFGLGGNRINQQQQQPMTINSNMIGQQQLQQQPQQQSYVNQMGGGGGGAMGNFGRPGGMSGGAGMLSGTNQMGEEQGANLLSTVKNMFKL